MSKADIHHSGYHKQISDNENAMLIKGDV